MTQDRKSKIEARLKLPKDFHVLASGEILQSSDLVWSWTTKEWLRADAPEWLFSPLVYAEDIICIARRIGFSAFEQSVPKKRSYAIK